MPEKYAIMNILTVKNKSDLKGLHDERTRVNDYVNIRPELSALNQAVIHEQDIMKLYREALKNDYYTKRDERGRKHEKPEGKRVIAVNIVYSYSRSAAIEKDKEELDRWIAKNLEFTRDVFPNCPMVATLHMDETTPHIHVSIIPVTPSGKISARYFVGEKKDLQKIQDRYAEVMKEFGLTRGKGVYSRNVIERKKTIDRYRDLANRNDKLENRIKDLEQSKRGLEQEVVRERNRLEALEEAVQEARQENDSLRSENTALNKENEYLRGERRVFEYEYEEMRGLYPKKLPSYKELQRRATERYERECAEKDEHSNERASDFINVRTDDSGSR